jgi:catechol 2,3-dioxygenase-like lactoylglutathione lyase family enzyme
VPARRLLHCCYCCRELDAATELLEGAFGLRVAMRTSGERFDGAVLGLDGEVEARVAFVYDHRGPRTGCAIEVQAWVDPPLYGTAYRSAAEVGVQAIGIGVTDLDAALDRAQAHGCVAVGEAGPRREFGAAVTDAPVGGAPVIGLRDPTGVMFDLVEDPMLAGGRTQIRHLRVTCFDLDRSLAWYRGIGFAGDAPVSVDLPAGAFGRAGSATIRAAALALPDEPTALLLHQWVDPPSTGVPYGAANHHGLYRVAVAVDDTRGATRALEQAGCSVVRAPERIALSGTNVPDMWIAFLRDPDGVPLELVERPRHAFRA